MASYNELIQIVSGKIPQKKRASEEKQVALWVGAAVKEVSALYNWPWREKIASISITTSETTYDMPTDCSMLSGRSGILLDTNSKPTKNRLVYLDWDAFNDKYLRDQGDSEVASTPQYVVPLLELSAKRRFQIRTYPISDTAYTAQIPYFAEPDDNDAKHMITNLVLYNVYSHMPVEYVPDAHVWADRYRGLRKELKPQTERTADARPLFTQDVRQRKHNINQAYRQSRK